MKPAHLKTGETGEEEACRLLESKGYSIIQKNWRFGRSEIDVIAGKDMELVFVEVKTRHGVSSGYPELFVDRHKKKKMLEAATSFLASIKQGYSLRFDIIAVVISGNTREILHIENAFTTEQTRWK